jgi:hypothetical protein
MRVGDNSVFGDFFLDFSQARSDASHLLFVSFRNLAQVCRLSDQLSNFGA